ncbi:hypothetical protein PSACC_02862 [Paramicrosporidium saccamoebae]|uniref:UBX domain-containing protein n=1 Tax=Paramicrosporidium saccamoebae TaxID=1246581 RepID=A0A2H9TI10_9FUNG|nr:hypothetical protein PSACC_02862 [Paramicrosporidium saccamoebae]
MDDQVETTDGQIASFCAVTGADEKTAQHFLAAAGNDVELAVSLFLDNPTRPEPTLIEPEVRAPIQPRRAVLVDEMEEYSADNYPRNPPTAFPPMEPFRDFRTEIPYLGDTATDARGLRLASLFRPPTEIMFTGTFDAARRQARQQSRYLLVTVHNPAEFPCQQMVRDVWNDTAVRDFIQEELIFVFVTVGTGEAERYSQYYPFQGWPHWALVDPRTGKRVRSGTRVLKAPEMLMELVEYVSDHPLQSKRSSPTAITELEQSGTEEETVMEEGIGKPTMEESETGAETSTHQSKQKAVQMPEEPADGKDVLTVQIRYPDGTRQRRRFHLTDTINVIFDVVRATVPGLGTFDVQAHRESLEGRKGETVEEGGLKNATLTVVMKE